MGLGLITAANLATHPIEEGDAGIILRKDGGFQLFNAHAAIDPNNMTERQMEQALTLQAFAIALRMPKVMELLMSMSVNKEVVGDDLLVTSRH